MKPSQRCLVIGNAKAGNAISIPLSWPMVRALKIARDEYPLLGQRHNVAVQPPIGRLAVHVDRRCDQLRRRDEVRCAARVQNRARIRQCLHEGTRAAGVIQMHVRKKHEVDRCAVDAEFLERR